MRRERPHPDPVAEAVEIARGVVVATGRQLGIADDESEHELAVAAWSAVRSGFDPNGPATLATYARRCAINALRTEARIRRRFEPAVMVDDDGETRPLAEVLEARVRSALEDLIDRETWCRAMARLTPFQRRCARAAVCGFNVGEIAVLEAAGRL